jgi:General secretion pathway protein M.
MSLSARDKRALALLVPSVAAMLLYHFWTREKTPEIVSAGGQSIPAAESRLMRLRRMTAELPGKDAALKQAKEELDLREKGLIRAETASQAQAQVLQILRRLAKAQSPPIDIKGVELGQPKPLGEDYGEVTVSVSMECRIDQIINLLAELTAQPELVATNELRFGAASDKQKMIPVRLTVSGVVPRSLIPQQKGPGTF